MHNWQMMHEGELMWLNEIHFKMPINLAEQCILWHSRNMVLLNIMILAPYRMWQRIYKYIYIYI